MGKILKVLSGGVFGAMISIAPAWAHDHGTKPVVKAGKASEACCEKECGDCNECDVCCAAGADKDDVPNPFILPQIHDESTLSKMRHPLHKMRTTWEKYFRVYPEELQEYETANFEKVRTEPTFYLDRKIRFDVYLGKQCSFYRPFTSPFHQEGYANFSGWSHGTELWTKEGRGEVHPFFYVERRRKDLVDKLVNLPMFTPLHVWGIVRSKTDNLAWIEVYGAEVIKESVLNESTLRHIELASRQLARKRFDLAIDAVERALALEVPVNVEAKAYALLGRAYYELRDWKKARNAYANSILRDNTNLTNLIYMARADSQLQRGDEMRMAAQHAIVLSPSNPEAHAELGLALAMGGDFRSGYRELDFAQKLAPRGQLPEANRNRAAVAVMEKKYELAKSELNQAVILRAIDPWLHMELGDVHVALNELDDGKREYNQARELAPQRYEPYYKAAWVGKIQGDAAKKDGKNDDAKKLYEEALESITMSVQKEDRYVPAYGLMAEIYRGLGRPEDAKKALERGAAANPGSIEIWQYMYDNSAAMKDWDGMEKALNAMLGMRASGALYSKLGWVLSNRPNPDWAGAAKAYAEAVNLAPENASDWFALGHIRVRYLSDWAGGDIALNEAVKLDKSNWSAWYDLAAARREGGHLSTALTAANEALNLNKSVETRMLAAQLRLELPDGSAAEVMELVKTASAEAKSDLDRTWAKAQLAAAQLRAGDFKDAADAFAALEGSLKSDSEFNLWYGQALLKKGELDAAQAHFQKAIDISRAKPATGLTAWIESEAARGLAEVTIQMAPPPPAPGQPAPKEEKKEEKKGSAPVIEGDKQPPPGEVKSK